jgi:hypothetical protein
VTKLLLLEQAEKSHHVTKETFLNTKKKTNEASFQIERNFAKIFPGILHAAESFIAS